MQQARVQFPAWDFFYLLQFPHQASVVRGSGYVTKKRKKNSPKFFLKKNFFYIFFDIFFGQNHEITGIYEIDAWNRIMK